MAFDVVAFIKSASYVGVFTTILLENGVPILFFLPGDTLLLTAGFLAAQGILEIEILVVGGFITAIFGYMLGYFLGHKIGKKILYNGQENRYIKKEHLEKTKDFYNKYGEISLLLARFLPLRACVCFVAGVIDMKYSRFMLYNVIGAFAWGVVLPIIGYVLGKMIPIDDLKMISLFPLAAVILTLLVVPMILHRLHKNTSTDQQPPSSP